MDEPLSRVNAVEILIKNSIPVTNENINIAQEGFEKFKTVLKKHHDTHHTNHTGENHMQLDGTKTLALAKSAFGHTAKVKHNTSASAQPGKTHIIYYTPEGSENSMTLGYGASWEESLQRSLVTARGIDRVAELGIHSTATYMLDNNDATVIHAVNVNDGDELYLGIDMNGHVIGETMANVLLGSMNSLRVAPADLSTYIFSEKIASVLTPQAAPEEETAPTGAAAKARVQVSSAAKVSIPLAYVNPTTIRTGLLGWDDEVTQAAVLAATMGEHLLVVGPPGNAKSLFARRFFSHFEGSVFETQLSKYSDETAVFGAPNFRKLREEGVFEYPKHGIAAADWAFLDEIFDSSDVLLRTLLGILQEKKFTKGGHEEDVPLQSCIATANYTRSNDVTAAVLDRFAITVHSPVLTLAQRAALYNGKIDFEALPTVTNKIGIEQLKTMRAKSKEIEIPASIITALCSWCQEMKFTPRRERKLAGLLRASASLAGRRKVDENDIMVARFCVPISASGSVDSGKSLQPLKDAIMQSLHEGKQLAEVGKLAQPLQNASDKAEHIIKSIKETRVRIAELRSYNCVSEKVNQVREAAIQVHEAALQQKQDAIGL